MGRFEFKEGSSNKFWEVTVSGTLTVRFGRVGSAGQEKSKAFRFAFAICRDLPRAISTHAPRCRLFGL
jgi:predicted DNA-binding WGR domain protein